MIYLDNGATSFHKPKVVKSAIQKALECCANPGRGGYPAAMEAAGAVYRCRERVAAFFGCRPEQVVFTSNCTHGLNIAIRTLVKHGATVAISGFEHNAVTRCLKGCGAHTVVCGRKLFDQADTLTEFEAALKKGVDAAVFTHVSNVFGYILPVEALSELCRRYSVPFIVDAAQSAGSLPVKLDAWGADFIAMPGHKGLLGPQGTGILLCGRVPDPLVFGGTGNMSILQDMPEDLPERAEAGTLNVPGIAGLYAGIGWLQQTGIKNIFQKEQREAAYCGEQLRRMGHKVFIGNPQSGTVSFLPGIDCELAAQRLAERGIAVRAGLHCAPLAHESAGTLQSGTVRISFGHDACRKQSNNFLAVVQDFPKAEK